MMERDEVQKDEYKDDEINDSPIEEVRLVVPITDNPSLPVLTFRTWILGPLGCAIYASMNQFFSYRQYAIYISDTCAVVLFLFLGKLMAKTLPSKSIKVPLLNRNFSMNPGPFNIKEHFLLSVLVTSGADRPVGLQILSLSKVFYNKNLNFWTMLSVIQTSQLLGYGFAGIFMKFLVSSPYMWYPVSLAEVTFYRTLHEGEVKSNRRQRRSLRFFIIVVVCSFAYAIIPGYFFPSLGALSFVCLIWKKSILAQIIGSGRSGFGIGSIALDWNALVGYIGNPMVLPYATIASTMIGFILLVYVLTPIAVWTNLYDAKRFPIYSSNIFDYSGQRYNVSRVIRDDLTLDRKEYHNYSKVYYGIVYALSTGFEFATLSSTITSFVLYHARDTFKHLKLAYDNNDDQGDVHNRLMKKYNPIPQWWFLVILGSTLVLSILNCEFEKQLQLPYWGMLLICLLVMIFIVPFGVFFATTGQMLYLGRIAEWLWGYIYPSKAIAALVFRSYGFSTMLHALDFIYDMKVAHYMKIPPRSLFVAQIVGTLISSFFYYTTSWWILTSIENICHPDKLPLGSPWTCPSENLGFSSSFIWGVIGPAEVFFPRGLYSNLFLGFLIGSLATIFVWWLSRMFPDKKWLQSFNVTIMFAGALMPPLVGAVNLWTWFAVGTFFNYFVFRKYKDWWVSYNYNLANGLDLGVAVMALLTSFTLQLNGIYGVNWWGQDLGDHCPLAQCPIAPGVKVDGCPVF